LSTDSIISTGDMLLGWVDIASFSAGSFYDDLTLNVTYPWGLVAGTTYYVGVVVDDLGEVAESNEDNNASSGVAVTVQAAVPTASIDWGTAVAGASTINVYFAEGGEVFDDSTSDGWISNEEAAAMVALNSISTYIDVTFTQVFSSVGADFVLVADDSIPYLGYMNPPGTPNSGVGVFNYSAWTTASLAQGGDGFYTLIHEFGHGLGLAHPHDTGGTSVIMDGVTSAFSDYGDNDLNQGVFTTMSYNTGWSTGPQGHTPSDDYGANGTIGAFDIAVLQAKYGANTSANSGTTSYVLSGTNGAGTFYSTIWDVGGADEITYAGSLDAVINLQAATLLSEEGGGGNVSYVNGIHGGFTIANGVVIENASGGTGNDDITGNNTKNILQGHNGSDTIKGFGKADHLYGGDGADEIYGGDGNDKIWGDAGEDEMYGGSGKDKLKGGNDDDIIYGEKGNDKVLGNSGEDTLYGGDGEDKMKGGGQSDTLHGGADNDRLIGNGGNDIMYGEQGDDFVNGKNGYDTVVFSGVYSDYTVTNDSGVYTVTDNVGTDGTDTIRESEVLSFLDQDVLI
jgi:serralysin